MLTADRQPFTVSQTSVARNIHKPSDIHGDLTPEISFDGQILVDIIPDTCDFLFGKIIASRRGIYFQSTYYFC